MGILLTNPLKTEAAEPECIELDIEDAQMLMRVAQAEAGNQGIEGMWLVMSVILNRVESDDFPDTVLEVCEQPYQFADPVDLKDCSSDCHMALAKIEMGEKKSKIIGFETTSSEKLDKYFSLSFTEGDHKFYVTKLKKK